MTTDSNNTDLVRFIRTFIANPRRVAAIAPSGESLARLITKEILPVHGPVLELGAGTGVFTKLLLARGIREEDLTLVEFDPGFAKALQLRFPKARVVNMDATRLVKEELYAEAEVGSVVSGLPLVSMSPRKVMAIISGAFEYLRPQGGFYQFTYFPRCPVSRQMLERLGLSANCIGSTVRNLPPAAVYRITRTSVIDEPLPQTRSSNYPDRRILENESAF
jgi:phosphatidylethanolamine/phosphatidyl-N-methylethanolamine N-methyltransferase